MKPSPDCIALIKGFEKCKLAAYMPTPNDVPTIGWGATGKDIHLGLKWTQAQADARLASDIGRVAKGVNALVGKATTQAQFDALVSFAYNEGAQRLHDSSLLKYHLAGRYALAADCFSHFTTQKGVVLGGLVRRRKAEAALYLKASPARP